jgi:pimeloyl-ACP methyl ester carboxylesterase
MKPTPARVWGVRHFFAYKLPGAAKRFAAHDFAALPAIYKRWSPTWSPAPGDFADVRSTFSNRDSLDSAFGYYRKLPLVPQRFFRTKIGVPTVAFAGTDDPVVSPADYAAARRMFTADYVVEQTPGGHFMHREHPEAFEAKLLAHL